MEVFRQRAGRTESAKPIRGDAGSEDAEQSTVGPPAGAGTRALRLEAEQILRKLADLRRHHRGIARSIGRLEQDLAALLERAESDSLETSLGLLRRVAREDGSGEEFVIEV